MYVLLTHESDVSELRVETKFGVCDPRRFVNSTYVVTTKASKVSCTARKFVDLVHGFMGNKQEARSMIKLRANTANECQRMGNDRKKRKRLWSRKSGS